MKVLSLWQPWASAIALGHKRVETRNWATRYRGPLLIHAARTKVGAERIRGNPQLWLSTLQPRIGHSLHKAFHELPFGALVARCFLTDCVSTNDLPKITAAVGGARPMGEEMPFGDYGADRFAWLLNNIEPLAEPIRLRGQQGLFDIDDARLLQREST